jgi:PIN domain nuclease of toxin-antitoxin system
LDNALQGSDVTCIPIDRKIAMIAANLPEHHRDPADRLIIATTIQLNAHLLSLDGSFPAYSELAGKLVQM